MSLSVSAEDYSFDSEGGTYTFTVESNYEWSVDSDSEWLSVEMEGNHVTVSAGQNTTEDRKNASVIVSAGGGELAESITVNFSQGTRAENPYYRLIGQWEISSSKWYYSPNGSLNATDVVNPDPTLYNLIFDIEEKEYGKSYMMRNFLYPDTALEVRFDRETGNIIIPFGWTVHSYNMFLYVTLVGTSQFSYASLEVEGVPAEDASSIAVDLPNVDGFNYVGFGLWTYDDDGNKIAVGSRSYPTMFPMAPVVFKRYSPIN